MDALASRYTTGQVLKAVGVSNPVLQTWIRRRYIVGQHDDAPAVDMPGQAGQRRTFSFHAVMQIAVAKAILDVSGKAGRAFEAAMSFAHFGCEQRSPSVPFRDGRTWLLVTHDQQQVVNVDHGRDPLRKARWRNGSFAGPLAVVAVDVGAVFDLVCGALGAHPEAVIEAHTPERSGLSDDEGEIVA